MKLSRLVKFEYKGISILKKATLNTMSPSLFKDSDDGLEKVLAKFIFDSESIITNI
ncbi:hypothetical protein [Mycoplasma elephantis]|uniref:hypothetical protein n=1 Tax=Mycoplasma elephantis TaxID=114882 RepID=UPI000B29E294|nr:hypothetical protein [Mycoplasma elephantis]